MSGRSILLPNRYLDSVALLRLSGDLLAIDGIDAATAVMATPSNLDAARDAGLDVPDEATASDLFVGVSGTAAACVAALELATQRLTTRTAAMGEPNQSRAAHSIVQHVRAEGPSDLALISVPGAYAAAEAKKALALGMHVMIFSDNVALPDEIELKREAAPRGLLVMGPDCGTSIIGGVPLGFANVVRRGPIAVVGASGTGMQEVIARVHRLGGGISEAIGCGGRDLSAEVGAITMISALTMLAGDTSTDVIVLVSKPPAPEVLDRVVAAAVATGKPVVAVFVGRDAASFEGTGIIGATTLAEAADLAVAVVEHRPPLAVPATPLPTTAASTTEGHVVRGAFVGGTFCYEAGDVLRRLGVTAHELIDFGDDEYTVGRPHPMIDPAIRDAWVGRALQDPTTAVVLLDVVLGHGAHDAPVDGLVQVLRAQREGAQREGAQSGSRATPPVIAHVCGTDLDPQPRTAIIEQLEGAGVSVADSNAEAANVGGVGDPTRGHERMIGDSGLRVINIGLASFAATARATPGAQVAHLDWRPPADGDPATATLLASLLPDDDIDAANRRALDRYVAAAPVAVDVAPAREAIAGLDAEGRVLLHAGPPIDWASMCGPMRGALIGAALFEGWASNAEDATRLLESRAIDVAPCHHLGAVGPMAGVISPSMPVWVVEDAASGGRSYSNLNEGLGRVLRFGAYGPEVVDRLRWMAMRLGPELRAAVRPLGGIELKGVMAQALNMGDEVHNRNVAATGQLLKRLAPAIARSSTSTDAVLAIEFIAGNDHFFLNLSMAACKLMLDAAAGVNGSTLVTAMARNGVEFGIRTSGTGDEWFTAPAKQIDGLYFPGYGPADANPDLGDNAITETAGLGGFAMAAAPAIVGFVGGTPADATQHSLRIREITVGTNPAFTIPALGFAATAAGIDARLVVDTGILPVINTGIAHRDAGVGQIGAGITTAPWTCFRDALRSLHARGAARR